MLAIGSYSEENFRFIKPTKLQAGLFEDLQNAVRESRTAACTQKLLEAFGVVLCASYISVLRGSEGPLAAARLLEWHGGVHNCLYRGYQCACDGASAWDGGATFYVMSYDV